MTGEEIIKLARKAGVIDRSPSVEVGPAMMHAIGLFAALVAAAERAACLEICDNTDYASDTARIIRARGDK